jgi:hypothetical protein
MMQAKFDGAVEFKVLKIKASSWNREAVEKSAAGLDGVVSVDLGKRSRKITVSGSVEAQSKATLIAKTAQVEAMLDGCVHVLEAGVVYENVRVNSFAVVKEDTSGRGISCEFEMVLSQLRSN